MDITEDQYFEALAIVKEYEKEHPRTFYCSCEPKKIKKGEIATPGCWIHINHSRRVEYIEDEEIEPIKALPDDFE